MLYNRTCPSIPLATAEPSHPTHLTAQLYCASTQYGCLPNPICKAAATAATLPVWQRHNRLPTLQQQPSLGCSLQALRAGQSHCTNHITPAYTKTPLSTDTHTQLTHSAKYQPSMYCPSHCAGVPARAHPYEVQLHTAVTRLDTQAPPVLMTNTTLDVLQGLHPLLNIHSQQTTNQAHPHHGTSPPVPTTA